MDGGDHRPQLPARFAVLVGFGQRGVMPLQVFMDALPAVLDHPRVIRDQVTAGRAAVAVAVVVEPQHGFARAALALHQLVVFCGFLLGQAVAGHHVEARPRQQVARQDFLGQVLHHHLAQEPRPPFRQAPLPEVFIQRSPAVPAA